MRKLHSRHMVYGRLLKVGLFIALIFVVDACKMGPEYTRTVALESDDFRHQFPSGESIANTAWWELFSDTTLTNLIWEALNNNNDLRSAIARIDEASASLNIVKSNLYPKINYAGDGSVSYDSDNKNVGYGVTGGVNIAYTVDLWGRIRRLNEAALSEYLATEEAYRALTIIIVAETARAYFILRDLDNRLIISQQTADSWQDNQEIVEARYKGGFVSQVDVNQAKIQLLEAKTAIQTFTRLRNQTENAISVLLGLPPQNIPRGFLLRDQVMPVNLPTGLPSELLSRRPDVLATEQRLQAQNARIGAAEALRYPSLTLSADVAAQFINPVVGFSSLGAQLLGPIFNAGENKRRVEVEVARTEQLLNSYEVTFLNAIREVEDAMIAVETYSMEVELRTEQLQAAEEAARLSWVRYDGGLTSYLEVLDLQRSSFNSQLKASEAFQLQLVSTVQLYQALGGGWIAGQDSIRLNR